VNTLYSLHVFPKIGPNTRVLPTQRVHIRAWKRERESTASISSIDLSNNIKDVLRETAGLTWSTAVEAPPPECDRSPTANKKPLL